MLASGKQILLRTLRLIISDTTKSRQILGTIFSFKLVTKASKCWTIEPRLKWTLELFHLEPESEKIFSDKGFTFIAASTKGLICQLFIGRDPTVLGQDKVATLGGSTPATRASPAAVAAAAAGNWKIIALQFFPRFKIYETVTKFSPIVTFLFFREPH